MGWYEEHTEGEGDPVDRFVGKAVSTGKSLAKKAGTGIASSYADWKQKRAMAREKSRAENQLKKERINKLTAQQIARRRPIPFYQTLSLNRRRPAPLRRMTARQARYFAPRRQRVIKRKPRRRTSSYDYGWDPLGSLDFRWEV